MKKREYKIPVSKLPDPGMQGAPAALMRVLRRAHLMPHKTGTGVTVIRDGEVEQIVPDPELYEGFVPSRPRG